MMLFFVFNWFLLFLDVGDILLLFGEGDVGVDETLFNVLLGDIFLHVV